jgi:hypothetical protein
MKFIYPLTSGKDILMLKMKNSVRRKKSSSHGKKDLKVKRLKSLRNSMKTLKR